MNGNWKWMLCALVLATWAAPTLADECEWRDAEHYAEYKRVLATYENEVVVWFCAPCGHPKPERLDVFSSRNLANVLTHTLYVPTVRGAKGVQTFQNFAPLVQCPANGWPLTLTLDPDTLARCTVLDPVETTGDDDLDWDELSDDSYATVQKWTAWQGVGFTFRAPFAPMRRNDPAGHWITWTWSDSTTGVECNVARVDYGDPVKARGAVNESLAGQSQDATVLSETESQLAWPPVPGKMRALQFPKSSVLVGVYARGPALYIVHMRSRWSSDAGTFKAMLQAFRFPDAAAPARNKAGR